MKLFGAIIALIGVALMVIPLIYLMYVIYSFDKYVCMFIVGCIVFTAGLTVFDYIDNE